MIAVGDSGSVELIFHSTAAQRGKITKSATVTCNDPERASFSLRLTADVYDKTHLDSLKPINLSSAAVNWDATSKDKEQKLIVKNVSAIPLKMKLVSQPFGFVSIDVPDGDIKPGKTREIKVKVDPKFTGTDFQKSFTIELSDTENSRFTVPTVLTVVPPPAIAAPAPPSKKERFVDTTKTTGATLTPEGKH